MLLAFDNNTKQKVRKVIDYAHQNIYQTDDLLDMMNNQMTIPGEISEHQILVPIGRFICYYLVDHPIKGRCHYFHIKADAIGKLPTRQEIEHILKEFKIDNTLLDEHIKVDEVLDETSIILPFNL